MNNLLQWQFVSTGGGPDDGVNNPMLQHFIGNHNYYLPREIIQNSLDAKHNGSEPVKVTFKLESFTADNFPGYDALKQVFNSCKEYYPVTDTQAQNFIQDALNCMESEVIPFLKVSDYNTKGLSGEDDDKTGGWYNLVKSRGSSSKSAGEGGSFGIGKGAPFAASDLRIVFYSTMTQEKAIKFQGIAELISHIKDQDIKRGFGSYGNSHKSVTTPQDIPDGFKRTTPGTDIFIAGYKNEKGWEDKLIQSILRNFWYAIYRNDLAVTVENYEINSVTLEEFLVHYFANDEFKDHVEPVGNPLQYYLAVTSESSKMFLDNTGTLGSIVFHFNATEKHLNYVAMIRKSHMVIYSRRFQFPGNFAGVFICDDNIGNEELRRMEPPAHDKWVPERNPENGTKIIHQITEFIRGCLKQMKITTSGGLLEIPELYKYLPFDDGMEEGMNKGDIGYTGSESTEESSRQIQKTEVFEQPVAISPFKVAVLNLPGLESDGLEEGKSNSGGSGNGGGGNSGGNGSISEGDKEILKEQILSRAFIVKRHESGFDYKLILRSKITSVCNIRLTAVGEEGAETINIQSVTDSNARSYRYKNNNIYRVDLVSGEKLDMTIAINSPFKFAIKIDVYAL